MAIKKFETLDGINSNGAVVFANTLTVAGDLAVDTDTLYVDVSANNVGVNTTPSSAYALDVSGAMRATSYYGDGSNITGVTATNATTLNSLSSDKFLRSDTSDAYDSGQTLTVSNNSTVAVTAGTIQFNDGQRLYFGTGNDAQMYWDNPNLTLKITGADFNVSNTLYVDVSANNVGVNATPSSLYALDVGGSVRATSFVGNGSQLTGITATSATQAANSTLFDNKSSSQFLRSDTTDTHTSGTLIINSSGLRVNDNVNLNLGTGSDFTINFDGTKVNASGADLAVDTNTLYVDVSTNRVGVGKTNPSTALDVSGSVTATTYYGDGSNLTGISGGGGDATTLDGIDSTGFLRSNVSDNHTSGLLAFTTSDGLRVNDNIPVRFGTGSDIQFKYDGSDLNVTGTGDTNFSSGNMVVSSGSVRAAQGTTAVDNSSAGFTFVNDADTGMFNESSAVASGTLTFKCNNEEKLIISQPTNIATFKTAQVRLNQLKVGNTTSGSYSTLTYDPNTTVNAIYTNEPNLGTETNLSALRVTAGTFAGNVAVLTQNGTEGGELKFLDRNNIAAFYIDIDSTGHTRFRAESNLYIYSNDVDATNLRMSVLSNSITLHSNTTVNGTLTEISDQRLKSNIETLDGTAVYNMRGVSYTMDGHACSGVVAQEIQQVAPELVHTVQEPILGNKGNITGYNEYLGVNYSHLVGYLIEAIKDLKAEIDELKSQ